MMTTKSVGISVLVVVLVFGGRLLYSQVPSSAIDSEAAESNKYNADN